MYYFNKESRQKRLNKDLIRLFEGGYSEHRLKDAIKRGAVIDDRILFSEMYATKKLSVEYLLNEDASANEIDEAGQLPIMNALVWQRSDIALLLLKYTIDLNHRNISGNSIIMCAVQCGQYDVVEEILKKGVDLSFVNKDGKDIFSLSKNQRVKKLLEFYSKETLQEKKPSKQGWHIISKDEIAHIYQQEAIYREITEVFNFKSERQTKIIRNLETNAESHSERDMFTMNEDKKVRTAAFLLNDSGAEIDLEKIRNKSYKVIDGKVSRKSFVQIYK